MKTTVYLDVLLSVNTIINYFLLKSVAVFTGVPENKKRIIISSIVGSLFSLFIFIDLSTFISIFLKLLSMLLCSALTFGYNNVKVFLKVTIGNIIVDSTFTGLIVFFADNLNIVYTNNGFYYIGINPFILVTSVIIIYFLISVVEYVFEKGGNYIYDVQIVCGETTVNTSAFYDTGFNVKDILTHRPVMMASRDLFIKKLHIDVTSEDTIPVFYSDVTGEGILPCIKLTEVKIGNNTKLKNILLAICDMEFIDGAEVIFGKDIFNLIGE